MLHCPDGYQPQLDALVEEWIRHGVVFVGVIGKDCEKVHDIIDEICVGDGANPYYDMLTSWHAGETLQQAIEFGEALRDPAGPVEVVTL